MKNLKFILIVSASIYLSKTSFAQFTGNSPIIQGSAGNVAIGFPSYSPSSLLQVRNGSVLFEGTTGATPVSGGGTRMMWIPNKAAFRAGVVPASNWDDASIGINSFAVGNATIASGKESFACGWASRGVGTASFATGNLNIANGIAAFAAGGGNFANGDGSTVFGFYNKAQSYTSFVIGQYNFDPGNYNLTQWIATDPLFVVGNGTSSVRSNALTVLKNGNIGIGDANPNEKLVVNGTMKMNFNPIYLASDHWHGVGYFSSFTTTGNYASKVIDGPVLFGYTGGALGTDQMGNRNIALSWSANGNVGIGAANTGSYRLAVEGKVGAREVVITNASWADFVFETSYDLKSLDEIKQFIKENKHLPEIPSASEIENNGLSVGEIQTKQMQKIEELTLYLIQQNERIKLLEKMILEK